MCRMIVRTVVMQIPTTKTGTVNGIKKFQNEFEKGWNDCMDTILNEDLGGMEVYKSTKSLMKFEVDDKKLKMEISIKDIKYLFENDPNNFDESKIIRGKTKEFAEWIAKMLEEESDQETGEPYWSEQFTKLFERALEGDTETKDGGLIKYGN